MRQEKQEASNIILDLLNPPYWQSFFLRLSLVLSFLFRSSSSVSNWSFAFQLAEKFFRETNLRSNKIPTLLSPPSSDGPLQLDSFREALRVPHPRRLPSDRSGGWQTPLPVCTQIRISRVLHHLVL